MSQATGQGNEQEPSVKAAIAEFKAQHDDRQKAAKTLMPTIKTGMSLTKVQDILGDPSATLWDYSLFYSSTLTVRFDNDAKVTSVTSDVTAEEAGAGGRRDKTDPAIVAAISEFKSRPYSRQRAAAVLIPLIETGTPSREVQSILGAPGSTYWEYYLRRDADSWWIIRFGRDTKVQDSKCVGLDERR